MHRDIGHVHIIRFFAIRESGEWTENYGEGELKGEGMTLPIEKVVLEKNSGELACIVVLQESDFAEAAALRNQVADTLPRSLYAPDNDEDLRSCLINGKALGIRLEKDRSLIAFFLIRSDRPSHYAAALGRAEEANSIAVDYDDIVVAPTYRGNHLQALLLQLGEVLCEEAGFQVLYATVAPENVYSLRNVEEQGFLTRGIHEPFHERRYILEKRIGKQRGKRACILIDYTYDFVATDGKLTAAPAALEIEPAIAQALRQAAEVGESIYVMNDIHYEGDTNHPETVLFPPHNLAGSPGREMYGKVKLAVEDIESSAPNRLHQMDKTRYSAFAHTDLAQRLQEEGVTEVQLMGVCTDICVLHTAVDAYNLGFDIVVDENTVASFNPNGHDVALAHFASSLGATVIPTLPLA